MSIQYFINNEEEPKDISINNFSEIFTEYKEKCPTLTEALNQLFISAGVNSEKVDNLISELLWKVNNHLNENKISEIKQKYTNITLEDAQIISSYTCQLDENNNDYNIYKILNLNLNSNSKEEGIKKVSKYLYIFLKSLRKLPLYYPESGYLYKCIPIHIEQNNIKDDGGKIVPYAVGNQKTFWGFVSVFSNIVESYKYLGNKDKFKTGTIFNLVGNAWGYDISLFNIYGEEDILLDPERKFEVIESRPPINEIIDVRCEIKDTNLILENIFGIVEIRLIYLCKSKGVENIFGEEFVENNKNNIDIVINEKKSSPLINKCELNKGENMIKLIIKKSWLICMKCFRDVKHCSI